MKSPISITIPKKCNKIHQITFELILFSRLEIKGYDFSVELTLNCVHSSSYHGKIIHKICTVQID